MTEKDLRIEFHRETGKSAPEIERYTYVHFNSKVQDIVLEYLQWLEDKIVSQQPVYFTIRGEQLNTVLNVHNSKTGHKSKI
jgi:hypothetical protein